MKKYRYQLIIVLLIIFNICVVIKNKNHYYISEYAVSTNNEEYKLELNNNRDYKAKIYYPNTNFTLLDYKITDKIGEYIDNFKTSISKITSINNQYYTLDITYDAYSYQNYLSYVFYIETYTGGNHPEHDIWSIVYDKNNDRIVTIDDLMTTNPNFLKIVSEYSKEELLKNPKIVDTSILMKGIKEKESNFSIFAFSNDGLHLFFKYYQVAPYSSGSFVVKIPYFKIFDSSSINKQ